MNNKAYIVGFIALAVLALSGTAATLYALQLREDRELLETQQTARRFARTSLRRQERADTRLAELTFWDFKQRVNRHNREIDAQRARRRARA